MLLIMNWIIIKSFNKCYFGNENAVTTVSTYQQAGEFKQNCIGVQQLLIVRESQNHASTFE